MQEDNTEATQQGFISNEADQQRREETLNKDLETFANDSLEIEEQNINGIRISVCGHLQKGSGLTKYTVYLIKGQDKNGAIEVYRRFNEFWALREAMVERWPGCFIPAVPDKNALSKNDELIIMNRERFLNDFVKKVSTLEYLYYGEQFQTLVRSKEIDISAVFEKWPKPQYENIINKYRECFSELAGKQINSQTAIKISSFTTFLKTAQTSLPSYKEMAKSLAVSRSKLDERLYKLYSKILPDYEKCCLFEYVSGDENKMIYGNSGDAKLQEHANIAKVITKKNPYWLIYDLIKFEERDGQAFLEAINTRENLENKKQDIEIKIKENESEIQEISLGKSTFKTMTSRGTKQELKYRLQLQNQDLLKTKDNLLVLIDIISALLAYITIDSYKLSKKKFYAQTIRKISGYEINFIQNMCDIWSKCDEISEKLYKQLPSTQVVVAVENQDQ